MRWLIHFRGCSRFTSITRLAGESQRPYVASLRPFSGGSLPLALFAESPPVSVVVVLPIANYDNNQHAPNENLTLGSLRYGISTFVAILGAFNIAAAPR